MNIVVVDQKCQYVQTGFICPIVWCGKYHGCPL